jgi:acetyltransferase
MFDRADLGRFFNPRSAALVGATEDLSKFGGRCLRLLLEFGFNGRVYPINPKYDRIAGTDCFASVAALPEPPDHVGIVVPAAVVMQTLRQCAERGAKFATVFTAGFAESGTEQGRAMQAEITAFCAESGLRVMGPNCNGLVNFVDGFALTSTAAVTVPPARPGNVGIVSQSGGLGQVNVMWRAQQAGIPVSYEVSCGNDCDLDALDYARFMVEDAATEVVLLVLERIPGGAKLATLAADAAERGKPLVILKLGRTEEGSRAAASHTGVLTGSDAVHDAAFRRYGLIRVDDCHELYETAMLLRDRARRPSGRGLAGMAISGGNAVQLADLGASIGLSWPEYAPETRRRLAAYIPSIGTISNPTDLTAAAIGQKDTFGAVLEIIADDPGVGTVVPILTFASRAEITRVRDFALTAPKPVAVLWSGGCNDDRTLDPNFLSGAGVTVFRDTGPLLRAVSRAAAYGEFAQSQRPAPSRPDGTDLSAARAALGAWSPALTEQASKRVLAAYGLPITQESLATTAAEAVLFARRLGRPVALKIQSPDIPHKTEAGGVTLGLEGDAAIEAAFAAIMESARAYAPDARLEGVLAQEMVPAGVEMMLGVSRDPVFGPVLTVALGGIFVEILGDVAHLPAPVSAVEAEAMLRQLKGWPLLDGARGRPRADVAALADAMVRLSWLAVDLGDAVAEIDVNPAIVGPGGLHIADALVIRA